MKNIIHRILVIRIIPPIGKAYIVLFVFTFFVIYANNSIYIKSNTHSNIHIINNEYIELKKIYKWLKPNIYIQVQHTSIKEKIPIRLILAVIQAETQGRPRRGKMVIKNGKKYYAYGYMQVMNWHASSLVLQNMRNNISIGGKYLGKCYHMARENTAITMKNYNAGPNGTFYDISYIGKVLFYYELSKRYSNVKK